MNFEQKVALSGALLTGVEVLTKIAELAFKYLPEMFGPGDPEQSDAQAALSRKFSPQYPDFPDDYVGGSRVDWVGLEAIDRLAGSLADQPSDNGLSRLEREFDQWFAEMNDYHRRCLLDAIEAETQNSASFD